MQIQFFLLAAGTWMYVSNFFTGEFLHRLMFIVWTTVSDLGPIFCGDNTLGFHSAVAESLMPQRISGGLLGVSHVWGLALCYFCGSRLRHGRHGS